MYVFFTLLLPTSENQHHHTCDKAMSSLGLFENEHQMEILNKYKKYKSWDFCPEGHSEHLEMSSMIRWHLWHQKPIDAFVVFERHEHSGRNEIVSHNAPANKSTLQP